MEKVCIICGAIKSEDEMWWKCCPVHTTEQGTDVVCTKCKNTLHLPIEHRNVFHNELHKVTEQCPVKRHSGWGSTAQCSFQKEHDGPHSWVPY